MSRSAYHRVGGASNDSGGELRLMRGFQACRPSYWVSHLSWASVRSSDLLGPLRCYNYPCERDIVLPWRGCRWFFALRPDTRLGGLDRLVGNTRTRCLMESTSSGQSIIMCADSGGLDTLRGSSHGVLDMVAKNCPWSLGTPAVGKAALHTRTTYWLW
jgi:hypothetical protein